MMNVESSCIVLVFTFILTLGYEITILHTNDVHDRFEQYNNYGSTCKQSDINGGKCYGGVARRHTEIQRIRGSHGNVLLLDAGDIFVGTTWFTVHKGMAAAFFMKALGYDIMCLGNHEFDYGIEGLLPFLNNVTFPVVSANIDVSNEPRLSSKITKTWIQNVGGEQIAVIGYITPETMNISNPGPTLKFTDVISTVRQEVQQLEAKGINKIIALGHAGFGVDKEVAAVDGVDLVVGGHTNTFLYNGLQPAGETPVGPYPVVIDQTGGGRGLVVQAYTMGKYLGYLKLTFDNNGVVTQYSGNPILLNTSIEEHPQMLQYVNEWRKPVEEESKVVVGYTKVVLDGERESCRLKECNLGNMITDAIIDYHINYTHPDNQWAPAAIALWNGGGVRASIDKGVVTRGEVMAVMPFGNEIDLITVTGANLRAQLELSVRDWDEEEQHGRFLQMSGIHVIYNLQNAPGQRVVSVDVRCLKCDIPTFYPLKDNDEYKLFISTFMASGGDGYGFKPIAQAAFNTPDINTLTDYIIKHSPVAAQVEGRIRFQIDTVSAAPTLLSFTTLTILLQLSLFHVI